MRRAGQALAAVLLGALWALGAGGCSKDEPAGGSAEPGGAEPAWPQFRGPGGLGCAPDGEAYPTDWDGPSGRGILWKRDLAAAGHSSPIVAGDRVLVTGEAGGDGHIVCLDRERGDVLWDRVVASAGDELDTLNMGGGLCAPTPATDGRCVFAFFASGDLVAATLAGEVLWRKHLCDPVNAFGLSASPILWKDLVIVQLDQGNSEDDGLSAILAVDKRTSDVRWSTARPVPNSWSTPIIIPVEGRHELVTCANPFVIAYDPDTGAELWRAEGLGGDVVPMPTWGSRLVFAANADSQVLAIAPGGRGDVTASNVRWSREGTLPEMCSPVTDGSRLLLCEGGELTCYRAATGDVLWHEDTERVFWASPTLVGDLVYLPGKTGETLIFKLADKYEPVASPRIMDEVTASPAFAEGRVYLRTAKSLYCIGAR